ncbi:MAG: coenzyme F420-0:L-glutamate ligase, partial [Patescibacteria group bacterium]
MQCTPIKSPRIKKYDDLLEILKKLIKKPHDGDILVIASKVVALSQGRVINLSDIEADRSFRAKKSRYGIGREDPRFVELVKREADAVMPGSMLLAMKDGVLTPAAGIDLSNTENGSAILWPIKAEKEAQLIRSFFMKKFRLRKFGV